ncbi:hypothetical protein Q3G72_017734 [Acer saccharum]|nr:hypothetical protein Q3G72_017734 [Acer saccharum]
MSKVCAASDKQSNIRIELTPIPWDLRLLLVEYSQKRLLFHNPKSKKQSENTLIQHEVALSRALDLFNPLVGAQFVHAAADEVSVVDVIQPNYVPKIVYSFPLNGAGNYEGTSKQGRSQNLMFG